MNLMTAVLLILAPVVVNGPDENEQAAKWIEQLGDDDPAVRERATEALVAMGPDILPLVEKTLASDDPEVKSRAEKVAAVLRIKKDVRFSDNVLAWYPDIYRDLAEKPQDAKSVFQVFSALSEWDILENEPVRDVTDEDIKKIVEMMTEREYKGLGWKEKTQVIEICRTLRRVRKQLSGPPSGIEAPWGHQIKGGMAGHIAPLLKDEDSRVRERTVEALGEMKAVAYFEEIVPLLKDNNRDVRMQAISTIGKMKAMEYAKDLIPFLKDDRSEVRGWIAIFLVEIGKKDVVPQKVVEDIKPITFYFIEEDRRRAEAALRALGVSEEEIRKAKETGNEEGRTGEKE